VSNYQRPWWLLVNKPAGLITTIKEEAAAGDRIFIIRGEPLVQGLAWLTWGPVGALVVVGLLAALAINFNIREQSGLVRASFIAAFLGLPALAWGGATLAARRLSARHLQQERQAEAQECHICLKQQRGELRFHSLASPSETTVAYGDISDVQVTPALGSRDGKLMRLTLTTSQGKILLLNEALGTPAQKADLAHEIKAALKRYAGP